MKYIIFLFLMSFLFTQHKIETREIIIYKKSDQDVIDFSEYLDYENNNYVLSLSDINSFIDNNPKITLIDKCELKLLLSIEKKSVNKEKKVLINTESKGIEASICNDEFSTKKQLRISTDKSRVKVTSNNQKDFSCEFVFWVTGKFKNPILNNNTKNHGYLREWHDDDQLYIEYKFDNGKKNGEQRRWYINGQQEILYNYKHGKLNGLQLKWYKDGSLKSKMNFISDLQHGKSEEWYSNGQIKYVKIFDNGTLINILESYDIEGNIN